MGLGFGTFFPDLGPNPDFANPTLRQGLGPLGLIWLGPLWAHGPGLWAHGPGPALAQGPNFAGPGPALVNFGPWAGPGPGPKGLAHGQGKPRYGKASFWTSFQNCSKYVPNMLSNIFARIRAGKVKSHRPPTHPPDFTGVNSPLKEKGLHVDPNSRDAGKCKMYTNVVYMTYYVDLPGILVCTHIYRYP